MTHVEILHKDSPSYWHFDAIKQWEEGSYTCFLLPDNSIKKLNTSFVFRITLTPSVEEVKKK